MKDTKVKKISPKTSLFLALIIILLIALGFIGAAIGINFKSIQVKRDYIEVVSVISEIDHHNERAYAKYTPIGESTEIEVELNTYSSSYYVGKEIIIHYNPNNYEDVYNIQVLKTIAFVFILIGIVMFTIGFIPMIAFLAIQARANYYKKNFRKEQAKVLSIKTNYIFSIGNAHPRIITYLTKDSKSLKTTDYSSKFVNFEEGLVIDVYKNNKNGKYYADPESIRKGEIIEDDIFSIDKDKF